MRTTHAAAPRFVSLLLLYLRLVILLHIFQRLSNLINLMYLCQAHMKYSSRQLILNMKTTLKKIPVSHNQSFTQYNELITSHAPFPRSYLLRLYFEATVYFPLISLGLSAGVFIKQPLLTTFFLTTILR